MTHISSSPEFEAEIILSHRASPRNLQLAGEMVAAYAALNIWYVEELLLRKVPGKERDAITDPIVALGDDCRRAWVRYRDGDDNWWSEACREFTAAQQRYIAAIWSVLPPEYRPHPPARPEES
ncbi:hypothetical protein [Plantactinospora soyae]|uniref:Uncharacterized protein n=1 Tax=Plantactinospora soyae TaxID=1544732 RepID=A0A927M4E2_9ACTN|nr:hypothetical protein [Plantactinospora soyae]MBE1485273.1 hypothetical protein [Plantactinospora soyae]